MQTTIRGYKKGDAFKLLGVIYIVESFAEESIICRELHHPQDTARINYNMLAAVKELPITDAYLCAINFDVNGHIDGNDGYMVLIDEQVCVETNTHKKSLALFWTFENGIAIQTVSESLETNEDIDPEIITVYLKQIDNLRKVQNLMRLLGFYDCKFDVIRYNKYVDI